MANIIRSAKAGSEWTQNELDAYNIKLSFQNATTFFNTPVLPEPTVNQEVLTTVSADDTVIEDNYRLLTQLDLAMLPAEAGESAVDDFAVELFHALGYTHRPRAVRTRKEIRLLICGEYKYAKPDVCIIDRSKDDIILLVQEDKGFVRDPNPSAPLVAEAIAAFQTNNVRRVTSGLDPLEDKIIACIIMVGTSTTFFKVPITTELVQCV
ncbi:hypothetical protein PAXINDRAFT_38846, partial [Paxillus involutus ATCC 200175]